MRDQFLKIEFSHISNRERERKKEISFYICFSFCSLKGSKKQTNKKTAKTAKDEYNTKKRR